MLAQLIRKTSQNKPKRNRDGRCTAIFSDVDGVILPHFNGAVPSESGVWDSVSNAWQQKSYYRPDILDALRKHPADYKVWLTSWQEGATEAFADKVGPWEVLEPDEQQREWWHPGITDWWKANLLLDWAAKHPEVTHVVWCEDELNDEDRVDAARAVYSELRSRGIRVMAICPDSDLGLADGHIDMINAFAKGNI